MGKQLSDKNPDGTSLGQSATDKIGFYGTTPAVQGATIADLAETPATTAIAVAVNAIIARLKTVGLIASA